MTNNDFLRLKGLLAKLNATTNKASVEDGTFKKYHTRSIDLLRELPSHLRHIEQGLRTAKMVR